MYLCFNALSNEMYNNNKMRGTAHEYLHNGRIINSRLFHTFVGFQNVRITVSIDSGFWSRETSTIIALSLALCHFWVITENVISTSP